ncbi:SLC13 family permease [Natribacillus halophilus]|uniref:Anion transporter n=1 Tax=Natribacillus halophilus TaxID=549003 RepID=A0A1G8KHY1_9BACI|nr:SLC13 family permease [Natribacillus halophilus]SDI43006.1 anion transporter [Natribacillus halophilus]
MTTEAIIALVIFVTAIILLIWRPISPIVIGAMIPTSLALFGVIDADRAFADFANSTVIFFMSLLVVGRALFKTGLADFIGEKIIGLTGKTERGTLFGTSIVSGGMSGFLNDTGTTASLMSIVSAVSEKANVSKSKLLMTLAYFATIGGSLTLIGTTPNIVSSGVLADFGYRNFGFFEFTPIALPVFIVALLYILTIGRNHLPDIELENEFKEEKITKKPCKMILVAIIFISIIIAMGTGVIPMHVAAATGAILVVLTRCINVDEAVNSFSVTTLFLVAGIFPLSTALVETGAAEFIVNSLSPYLTSLSPVLIITAITFIMLTLTQFLMSTSTVAIMAPMGILIGESAGIDPAGVVIAIAIAGSTSLATPFGTGPTLLIWEAGGYKATDYLRVGVPLSILSGIVISTLTSIIYL